MRKSARRKRGHVCRKLRCLTTRPQPPQELRQIALQTWSEAQINPLILSSVRTGMDGPRAQLAQLIRRAQAAKQLTSTLDADSIAHTVIALFHGSVLQKLWRPDMGNEAHFAIFEHFLGSLELA